MDIVLSSILASLGNALFGVGSTISQNKYNSPKAQLRRLREAGLPLTYMYQGKVNTQSTAPQLSLEPTLGTAKKLELHQQNEMNQGRLREIDAQIKKMGQDMETSAELANLYSTNAAGKFLENQRTQRKMTWEKNLSGRVRTDRFGNEYEYANDAEMLELQKGIDSMKYWISSNEGRIRKIMADVEDELFGEGVQAETKRRALAKVNQQITNLLSQDELLGQMYDIRNFQALLNEAMSSGIETKDDFTKALMWAVMQLFGKINVN